jgi:hypothetical protein
MRIYFNPSDAKGSLFGELASRMMAVSEKVDNPVDQAFVDCPPVFPVRDRGGCHANVCCYILLEKAEFETPTAQVIAESDGLYRKFWKRWNFKGNFDFISRSDQFEILGKGVHTPASTDFLANHC